MAQDLGETRDAMIEDDNNEIEKILNENKDKKEPYWIVIFAKPAKVRVDGKPTLVKLIKAYHQYRPKSMVGMIIGEVSNKKGVIDWEVNMPQAPIDYDALGIFGVEKTNEVIYETTTIPSAYVTQ